MKFAWRKRIWSALILDGRPLLSSAAAPPRSRAVSVMVSTSGCFSTETTTAGLAHVARIAALDLGREFDARDLAQENRAVVDLRHHDAAQIIEAGGAADVADEVFAGMQIGEAAAGIDAELRKRLFDLLVGDAERAQRRRMRGNAVLPDLAADRDDLGDARECSAAAAGW